MWYQSLASFVKENAKTFAVGLNCRLDDATLVCEMRKPFAVLAEGLISKDSRGDRTAIELFVAGVRGWGAGLRRRLEDALSNLDRRLRIASYRRRLRNNRRNPPSMSAARHCDSTCGKSGCSGSTCLHISSQLLAPSTLPRTSSS